MSVTIPAGQLEATFLPEVGMLGTSLRIAGHELADITEGVANYRDGHQTGLPLLAPWANRLDGWRYRAAGVDVDLTGLALQTDENGLPIHGTMTAAPGWDIVVQDDARLRARFAYGARPDLLATFPFPHDLEIDARVDGSALRIETTLRPTSDRPVPVAFGGTPTCGRRPAIGRRGDSDCRHADISSSTRAASRPGRRNRKQPSRIRSATARSTTSTHSATTARSPSSPRTGG